MELTALDEADLTTVAAFLNDCWRAAYADILDADFLAGLTTADRVARLRRHRARGSIGLVAWDQGVVVGVVMAGPSHLPECPQAGEIDLLYVHPQLIGTGLGHRLLIAGEANLRERGYTTVCLDAFSANTRAIGFYTAHGYSKVGTAPDHLAANVYPLDIMAKPLS